MPKEATQTMELAQATQMIQWLDEERRKDKAAIATLQEQVRSQEQLLTQQAAYIQDLQNAAAGSRDLIARAANFEETVSNYKNELVLLLDQREAARKKEQVEADRLRTIELEATNKQVGELDKRTQVLRQYGDDYMARQAEEKRLNDALQRLEVRVSDLAKHSDDRVQSVTYLEEQRRADNRRIAELEQETTELRKKVEAQAAKALLLEETIQKQKSLIEKETRPIKDFQKVIDEARASEFRRDQAVKKYTEQAEQVGQEMEEWRTQTQRFIEQYQLNKRSLEKLEGFQARLEKRQNEVAEMQRLAEDRLKRQWEEWQVGRDKEQKKYQLTVDEQWKAQQAANQAQDDRVTHLEGCADAHLALLEALIGLHQQDAHRCLESAQDRIEQAGELPSQARAAQRSGR